MTETRCFMLEELELGRVILRRYSPGACPSGRLGYHNAEVIIEAKRPYPAGYEGEDVGPLEPADPRWPAACSCGYAFKAGDGQQRRVCRLHRALDGLLYTLEDAPAGAMGVRDAWGFCKGPDGHCLMVKLPDGCDWCIDGPSTNGKGWTRTGTPPNITATPSILTHGYHGFLTNGVLRSV